MSLQKGKILDLRMDRGFKDSTPYENHGTATDVTLGADRKGNTKAGVFNGTSSYIDCGSDNSLRLTNTATISAWIKYSGNIGEGDYSGVIGSTKPNHCNWVFQVISGRKIQLRAWNGIADNVTSNSAIALNTWTLITAVIDISSGYVEIYINGTLDIRDTNFTFTSLYNNEPNTLTKIGVYNSVNDGYFDGQIDDVRIYNRALSEEEITKLYESYNPCLKLYGGDKEIKSEEYTRVDKNVNNAIYFEDPESNLYGKTYFYVMKYQARNNGGVPQSTGTGLPWVSINQTDAITASENAGLHLITNWEWMAIARDIEQVADNWTGGAVGSGMIKRGNVGITDDGSYNGADPETGILNDKAKLKLSNGEEIYHFSGNVWEWVDDKIECGVSSCPNTLMPYGSTPASGWVEFTDINTWGKYSKSELGPLGNYNSTNGVGKIHTDYNAALGSSDTYTHAFLRGGYWGSSANAGVFALNLGDSPAYLGTGIGFRCARYGNE